MSPLTADDRRDLYALVLGAGGGPAPHVRFDRLCELADKLEAEPEPPEGNPVALRELALARAQDVRERDEAREVLREVLLLIAESSQHPLLMDGGEETVERARVVAEGVERTHALVPVAALERAADRMRMCRVPRATVDAFEAAARGEHVSEWPS